MKKIISFVFAIATVAVCGAMFSCGGGTSSPGAAAKKYVEYVAAGDYDKFLEGVYFSDNATATDVEQGKAMLRSLLTDKVEKEYGEKGGLKSVEVLSENISEDGKTAKVEMRYTYGNGETSDEESDMILVDGKWLMNMNK
jgi:hypothetical protein